MNGLHDSHKRTSISQLLNPLASSHEQSSFSHHSTLSGAVGPPPQQGQHDQQGGPPFQQPYNAGTNFNLRAASWDHVQEDPNGLKRKPGNGATTSTAYHQPLPNGNGDHGPNIMRPRGDVPPNYMEGGVWPAAHEIAAVPYGAPVISPMYSDERTAISGDYPQNNQYNQQYQDQTATTGPPQNSAWQITERASVRIAARGTAQESPSQSQPRYNMPHPFYGHPGVPFVMPLPTAPQQKRPSSAIEDVQESTPKTKRTKAKPKVTTESNTIGNSKRGYSAKKRSEAAQIAAQNAQLLPIVSYAQVPTEKGKEKAAEAAHMVIVDPNAGGVHPDAAGLHPELQFARCMSNRYRSEQFPRCVSCTRRWAGDTCRFQAIRFFLKDSQRNIVGVSFVENQKPDAPSMEFPVRWNVPLEPVHFRRTKRTIAHALLPTLKHELQHLSAQGIIIRPRESDVRATCDTCMTSIFSSSWMCRLCGREACAECFEQVQELTVNRPGASGQEIAQLQARREKHAHTNPFFLSCTKRNEHQSKDFSPVSRFCRTELSDAIKEMEAVLAEPDIDALPVYGAIDPALDGSASVDGTAMNGTAPLNPFSLNGSPVNVPSANQPGLVQPNEAMHNGIGSADTVLPAPENPVPGSGSANVATSNDMTIAWAPPTSSISEDIPCHPTHRFADTELTEDIFRPMWARGEPLIVTGLLSKFKVSWTPEYFIEKYSTENCLIIECQTDRNKRVTVGEFFSGFGKYEDRTECWKLKDWPPTQDFKKSFPELYEDFAEAVPVPNYVRRDGALNIASHFPKNTVAPDLGPKMYNAMCSFEGSGSKGSTRLHMDMADAVNIMTYASAAPDGTPGCAAWDLFRAEDSDKLRKFLRKRFQGAFQHDPIHSQQVYLDSVARKELLKDYGVKSHRVYQRPGEAVFIPAGCAHQVSNLADCIKVAVDFVSPENISRCEKLTREFREQNQSMVWKEDVLQLRTMMWFAWLSCRRQESTD